MSVAFVSRHTISFKTHLNGYCIWNLLFLKFWHNICKNKKIYAFNSLNRICYKSAKYIPIIKMKSGFFNMMKHYKTPQLLKPIFFIQHKCIHSLKYSLIFKITINGILGIHNRGMVVLQISSVCVTCELCKYKF